MELWIRSQEKNRLLRATDINVRRWFEEDEHAWVVLNGNSVLGSYSMARCYEILDNIQSLMENSNKYLIILEECDYQTYEQSLDLLNKNKLGILCYTDPEKLQVHPLTETIIYQMPEK